MDLQHRPSLADRYRLDRELGAGGMATVFLAEDLKHKRQVAVKILRSELSAQLGHERFLREITTTANLRHPNILPLFDSGEVEGSVFYVMPYVEGETLRDRMTRDGALPIDDALQIVEEVADALSYAHDRGVIHRDIKPENILLERGHAIVADFGIAHAASAAGKGDEKLTMVGMALGTPHYMSPEQGSGDVVDARSDLYALACVLYEMLTGKPPYTGPTPMAVLIRHSVEPIPSVTNARPEVPARVAEALARAVAKSPDDRFNTIQHWRDAIKMRPAAAASAVAFHKPPPVPATTLLGREEHLGVAVERVVAGARVLSITGYGGTGKTRFAIEMFRRLEKSFSGGAAFISLASVTSAVDVMPAIGIALDISEAHGRSSIDAIATVVGDRRVLLVLDNLEQVLGAAGDIATLVSRCPALHVVATTRAPLKIGAEFEFLLPPLELPPEGAPLDVMRACASVVLFLERAKKVKPEFALTAANAPDIAAICRKLDGLPLALELATARVRVLEPAALLQRLDHSLDLLTSGDRDLPLRQRTLRATISWSYSLLEPSEQRLLRRLSVFHEGWTLEAMEHVCYCDDDRHLALDELDSLVEKGLVRVVGGGERYALLETIRAFAAEQSHAGGEVSSLRDAHAAYYVAFGERIANDFAGRAQVAAVQRALRDNPNTQAALVWLVARAREGDAASLERGLMLAGSLNWFWHVRGLHLTAHVTLDALLALATNHGITRGHALARLTDGMICTVLGEWDRSLAQGIAAARDGAVLGDRKVEAEGFMYQGYTYLHLGQMAEAHAALDRAIEISVNGVSDFMLSTALAIKGVVHFASGDVNAGITLEEKARVIQIRNNNEEIGGLSLSFLAQMTFVKGDLVKAMALYREALVSFERVGDRPEIARVHCEMGWAALAASDVQEASQAFQLAVRAYEDVGSPRGTGLALMGLAAVEAAAGRPERAVQIATSADALSKRAGVVIDHTMDPGVVQRMQELKATIPERALGGLVASASELTPAGVLVMVGGM